MICHKVEAERKTRATEDILKRWRDLKWGTENISLNKIAGELPEETSLSTIIATKG